MTSITVTAKRSTSKPGLSTHLTEDEVVLVELSIADLLVEGVTGTEIDVGLEVQRAQLVTHLSCVLVELEAYR